MSAEFTRALLRTPARSFTRGLTTADRGRPDLDRMLRQHREYAGALSRLGLEVTVLPALEAYPDAHFVEDAAVILPGLAVLTRSGAPQRRGESGALEPVLAGWREIARIEAPGTLDGGDVLEAERELLVGISRRTDARGAKQLGRLAAPKDYRTSTVPVSEGLHLKSSVSYLGRDTLLLTAAFASEPAFAKFERIVVSPEEAEAANVLAVNGTILIPAGFPRTRRTLEARGFETVEVDNSEARKMDGGLTCMSLLF